MGVADVAEVEAGRRRRRGAGRLGRVASLLEASAVAATGALVALAISGLILLALGYQPLLVYRAIWEGAFGDLNSFVEVLLKATPLILIGAGLAVAFRASMWNIGAEGQLPPDAVQAVEDARAKIESGGVNTLQ